jgi:dTMP kinase
MRHHGHLGADLKRAGIHPAHKPDNAGGKITGGPTIRLEANDGKIECPGIPIPDFNSTKFMSQSLPPDTPHTTPSPTSMHRGLFIVIEGIDGTGKSTQARRLGEWFASHGREVVLSREPTDGPWGRKLRESATTTRLSPEDELQYFLNDRRQHVEEKITPALSEGKVVILDRYYFSTMAYQGARGFDPAEIRRLNEEFAPIPDLLLILDLDVDAAHQRIGHRGDSANEFEKHESLQRCREIFLSLRNEPFARIIDSNGDLDEVSGKIRSAVQDTVI